MHGSRRGVEVKARRWALGALLGFASLTALGAGRGRWGRGERECRLPGDEVLERPTLATTYSAVIDAEPEAIWPWIEQIARGYIRRAAAPNGEHVPRGAVHKVGIVTFEPPRVLVLRSMSTVAGRGRSHAQIDWVWAFVLDDLGGGDTRVILRLSSAARPLRAAVVRRLLAVPGESVRARRLMAGLARRATREREPGAAGTLRSLDVVPGEEPPTDVR